MSGEKKEYSGKAFIKNNAVIWEFDNEQIVNIPINKIKLIAEYTTANGPFMDDWFIIFYNDKSEYFEISMYSENIQKVIEEIGKILNVEILPILFSSADWKSTILFPEELKGEELWTIVDEKPKSFFDKLKSFIGMKKKKLELTSNAEAIIK